jgi:hypothetical protein
MGSAIILGKVHVHLDNLEKKKIPKEALGQVTANPVYAWSLRLSFQQTLSL